MTLTPKFSYLPSFGLVCSTLNTNQLSTTIYKPVANVIEKKIETLIPIRSSNYVIEKKLLVYMIEMVCTVRNRPTLGLRGPRPPLEKKLFSIQKWILLMCVIMIHNNFHF